jgi:hypothetical protein
MDGFSSAEEASLSMALCMQETYEGPEESNRQLRSCSPAA